MENRTEFSVALIKKNMDRGEFGVEKESLRIDAEGHLSHSAHPFGSREDITRDFCENQTEMITDVYNSVEEVLQHLRKLHTEVVMTLQELPTGREYLWPFSNPPYVQGAEDIPVAQFEGKQSEKTIYRNYLADKYGKRKMLFSGIHLNYSFTEDMIQEEYQILLSDEAASNRSELSTFQSFKNHVYIQLVQKLTKYSWLIVYLTASSPVLDDSFLDCGNDSRQEQSGFLDCATESGQAQSGYPDCENKNGKTGVPGDKKRTSHDDEWSRGDMTKYASARCGELGYWNDFIPVFDYQNLESYIKSIESYIQSGQLKRASELYYPLRLKPRGENSLEHLREKGVNHIELRMLDVNPLSPIGLIPEDVEFLHYFMVYLHYQEEIQLTEEEQINAIINEKQAALFDDSTILIRESDGTKRPVREAALEVLQQMERFYSEMESATALRRIEYQKEKLTIPGNRYADRIRRLYETDYVEQGINLAGKYTKQLLSDS